MYSVNSGDYFNCALKSGCCFRIAWWGSIARSSFWRGRWRAADAASPSLWRTHFEDVAVWRTVDFSRIDELGHRDRQPPVYVSLTIRDLTDAHLTLTANSIVGRLFLS